MDFFSAASAAALTSSSPGGVAWPGSVVDRLQADRAGFTGPQVFGQRVGGVRLVRRLPGGAGLPGFLLRGLEV